MIDTATKSEAMKRIRQKLKSEQTYTKNAVSVMAKEYECSPDTIKRLISGDYKRTRFDRRTIGVIKKRDIERNEAEKVVMRHALKRIARDTGIGIDMLKKWHTDEKLRLNPNDESGAVARFLVMKLIARPQPAQGYY